MRILIVKLSSIGDVVHAMPAAAALRRSFPHARLVWAVERIAAPLLIGSPILDDVVVLDTRAYRRALGRPGTWRTMLDVVRRMRGPAPDVAIDFQGLWKSAVVSCLSGAQRRIGFAAENLREPGSRFGYTDRIAVDNRAHVIDNNLALARAAGADRPDTYEFPFPNLDAEADRVRTALDRHGIGRFAIVNPGGGWITKLWPPDAYARLADRLWDRHGLRSVVTVGPGEDALAEAIVSRTRHATAIPTDLREFVALARRAELFVGGDTGPLHLAAACGTPIVGIYGPTAPERNGPFDPADRTVGRDIPCRIDCHRRTCGNHICMDIPVEAVARAVAERLNLFHRGDAEEQRPENSILLSASPRLCGE